MKRRKFKYYAPQTVVLSPDEAEASVLEWLTDCRNEVLPKCNIENYLVNLKDTGRELSEMAEQMQSNLHTIKTYIQAVMTFPFLNNALMSVKEGAPVKIVLSDTIEILAKELAEFRFSEDGFLDAEIEHRRFRVLTTMLRDFRQKKKKKKLIDNVGSGLSGISR